MEQAGGPPDFHVTPNYDLAQKYNVGEIGYADPGYGQGVWYTDVPIDQYQGAQRFFFQRPDGYYQFNLYHIDYFRQNFPGFFTDWKEHP